MVQTRNKKKNEEKSIKKVNKIKKSIKFNDKNIKEVYYTYSSNEYNRTYSEINNFNYKNDLDDYFYNNFFFDDINLIKKIYEIDYAVHLLINLKNQKL